MQASEQMPGYKYESFVSARGCVKKEAVHTCIIWAPAREISGLVDAILFNCSLNQ